MEHLFMKGFTYGFMAKRGQYRSEEALDSLKKLKETGTEWIALAFVVYQEKYNSTKIYFDYENTPTDKDIIYIINKAHDLGMKVLMKPIINCLDGLWRARITFPEDGFKYWEAWFKSYRHFLLHYAEIAQETNCEMFCLGCEMVGTERQTKHWRHVIREVRKVYSGPLTYNANHGKEDQIEWFDDVDVIGTSAYYPVATQGGESEEVMIKNWEIIKERIYKLHQKFNKPICFAEIGCRSAYSCATMPWDFIHTDLPMDEDEQANFYSSVLKVFWNEPWFAGFFWWDWSHRLHTLEDAKQNRGFGIYGKKAEEVIKTWYEKNR